MGKRQHEGSNPSKATIYYNKKNIIKIKKNNIYICDKVTIYYNNIYFSYKLQEKYILIHKIVR